MLMDTMQLPPILITSQDAERLSRLLDVLPEHNDAARALDHEIARATVVSSDEMPNDVVTMNSKVVFEDLETGKRTEITLVYPHEANFAAGKLSILSAVGTALLGLRVGQSIKWELPSGKLGNYRVASISYQPEASGHPNL